MIIDVKNGIGAICIGQCNVGSYFRCERPIVSALYDFQGSLGKYLALLPYSIECREILRGSINEELYKDFTGSEPELRKLLEPLLRLLKNGKYAVNYFSGKDQTYYNNWNIEFGRMTEILDTQKIISLYNRYIEADEENTSSIIDFSSYHHYVPSVTDYIATQSLDTIDNNHVRYLGNRIVDGERPAVIVYKNSIECRPCSDTYVIDGHHKLLAYRNIGLSPAIIEIISLHDSNSSLEFDLEELAKSLYPWQVEHILNLWDDKSEYLDKVLQNPNSILHRLVKNGLVREYHKNGQLKKEAYYINDSIDGVVRSWHENGQLAYEHAYNKGVETGIWISWDTAGLVTKTHGYDELGRFHGSLKSYYDNEQIRSETVYNHGLQVKGIPDRKWYRSGRIMK